MCDLRKLPTTSTVTPVFYIYHFCTQNNNSQKPSLILHVIILGVSEKLLVKEDPSLYHHINQGCLDVDGMDDKEEMQIADVCTHPSPCDNCLLSNIYFKKFSIFWKN